MVRPLPGCLTRIYRTVTDDPLDGVIMGRSRKWTLVAVADENRLPDGYALIREPHVESISVLDGTFTRPRPLSLDLGRTMRIVATLARRPATGAIAARRCLRRCCRGDGQLIGVYIEKEDPDVMFVGLPFLGDDKSFGLDEVRADGTWVDGPSRWRVDRVTRIDFGSQYLAGLPQQRSPI